jgi:hypothetical protein
MLSSSTMLLFLNMHAVNAPEVLVTSASDQTGPKIKRGKIIFYTDICLWYLSVNQPALQQRACSEQMRYENLSMVLLYLITSSEGDIPIGW